MARPVPMDSKLAPSSSEAEGGGAGLPFLGGGLVESISESWSPLVWPIIVQSGIKNTPDNPFGKERLIKYAKDHCSHRVVSWLFKNRDKLTKLIDDTWAWEEVDSFLATADKTTWQRSLEARRWPCVCGGRWEQVVLQSFQANEIDSASLCYNTLNSLHKGRSEACKVVTLAGRYGGEGKSFFFAPLRALFKEFLQEKLPEGIAP